MISEKTLSELRMMSLEDANLLSYEELEAIKKTDAFKKLMAEQKAAIEATPGLAEDIGEAMFRTLPERTKRDCLAIRLVIDQLACTLDFPDVRASDGVSRIVSAVHSSLSDLTMMEANYESIAKAFAVPLISARNSANASQPRAKENLVKAMKCFAAWEKNTELYDSKADFKRDLLSKGLCKDIGTAGKWLSRFISNLPNDSVLKLKLNK